MCGTPKQEVNTEEEEAASVDNKVVQRHHKMWHIQNAQTHSSNK